MIKKTLNSAVLVNHFHLHLISQFSPLSLLVKYPVMQSNLTQPPKPRHFVAALPNLILQMEMGLKLGLCATLLPPSSASVHLIVHMAVLDSTLQGVQ